jgi:hypothetical protein
MESQGVSQTVTKDGVMRVIYLTRLTLSQQMEATRAYNVTGTSRHVTSRHSSLAVTIEQETSAYSVTYGNSL